MESVLRVVRPALQARGTGEQHGGSQHQGRLAGRRPRECARAASTADLRPVRADAGHAHARACISTLDSDMTREEGRDELDEQLARTMHTLLPFLRNPDICLTEHSRYLYQLQEPDTTTDESGGSDSWDSDESSASARAGWQRRAQSSSRTRAGGAPGKRRMSLLTGQYFDVPAHEHGYEHYECGAAPMKSVKRRFFASAAWDGGRLRRCRA